MIWAFAINPGFKYDFLICRAMILYIIMAGLLCKQLNTAKANITQPVFHSLSCIKQFLIRPYDVAYYILRILRVTFIYYFNIVHYSFLI